MENRLIFNHNWTLLKAAFTTGKECIYTAAETAYGILERDLKGDAAEYYMQRFLDVQDQEGRGLAIANDGKYAFNITEDRTQITLAEAPFMPRATARTGTTERKAISIRILGLNASGLS